MMPSRTARCEDSRPGIGMLSFERSEDSLIRMIATQPRRFGEAARATEETTVHHTRLLMYMSKEMMKSYQRWQTEFARGQRTPRAT
jgi:hypothetical protein